jgi:hypothetical protein
VQISHDRIQIKLYGASTSGVIVPVRTKYALSHGFRLGARLFLINEAMRDQLICLFAMDAFRMIHLHGVLVNSLKTRVVDLHHRTQTIKVRIMPYSISAEKFASPHSRYISEKC